MMSMFSDAPPPDDKALLEPLGERNLASELFNLTWDFLGMESRTPAEDDAMVHAAHARRRALIVRAGHVPRATLWRCTATCHVVQRHVPRSSSWTTRSGRATAPPAGSSARSRAASPPSAWPSAWPRSGGSPSARRSGESEHALLVP